MMLPKFQCRNICLTVVGHKIFGFQLGFQDLMMDKASSMRSDCTMNSATSQYPLFVHKKLIVKNGSMFVYILFYD